MIKKRNARKGVTLKCSYINDVSSVSVSVWGNTVYDWELLLTLCSGLMPSGARGEEENRKYGARDQTQASCVKPCSNLLSYNDVIFFL